MPRPNPPRDVYAEQHLALRIAREREARGWTYEGLAARMRDAGCPINQSAIYKVERADPPRRITVDELVAYSRVFGVSVEELLLDPEIDAERRLLDVLGEWRALIAESAEIKRELLGRSMDLEHRIRELAGSSPSAERALRDWLADTSPSWTGRLAAYFNDESE